MPTIPPGHTTVVNKRAGSQRANVNEEELGEDSINGFVAKGTRITRVFPAGQMGNEQPITIVTERWYSDGLKSVVRIKQTDPRNGETLTELTNVATGDPDPALFQIPSDYTVEDPPNLRSAPITQSPDPR